MRSRGISCLVWGAFFVIFVNSLIVKTEPSAAANCALFVRAETGIALYGVADRWWGEARGRYARGYLPAPGAIVVFKRSGHMPSGHVAIVTRVVSANQILVDHANWPHGTVGRGVSVSDTSTNHDWSQVAVMDRRSGRYGRDNPVLGFIYLGPSPHKIVETHDAPRSTDLDVPLGLPSHTTQSADGETE
jgi:surface antigen